MLKKLLPIWISLILIRLVATSIKILNIPFWNIEDEYFVASALASAVSVPVQVERLGSGTGAGTMYIGIHCEKKRSTGLGHLIIFMCDLVLCDSHYTLLFEFMSAPLVSSCCVSGWCRHYLVCITLYLLI